MEYKYKFKYIFEIEDIRIECLLPKLFEFELPLNCSKEQKYDVYDVAYDLINCGVLTENSIKIGNKKGFISFEEGNENYSFFKVVSRSKEKPYIIMEKADFQIEDIFNYGKEKGKEVIEEKNCKYISMDFIEANVYEYK